MGSPKTYRADNDGATALKRKVRVGRIITETAGSSRLTSAVSVASVKSAPQAIDYNTICLTSLTRLCIIYHER